MIVFAISVKGNSPPIENTVFTVYHPVLLTVIPGRICIKGVCFGFVGGKYAVIQFLCLGIAGTALEESPVSVTVDFNEDIRPDDLKVGFIKVSVVYFIFSAFVVIPDAFKLRNIYRTVIIGCDIPPVADILGLFNFKYFAYCFENRGNSLAKVGILSGSTSVIEVHFEICFCDEFINHRLISVIVAVHKLRAVIVRVIVIVFKDFQDIDNCILPPLKIIHTLGFFSHGFN